MFKFVKKLFRGKIDANQLDELEEMFYEADLGATTSAELTELVHTLHKEGRSSDQILEGIKQELQDQLLAIPHAQAEPGSPHVILIVGVNGNGKTTTVAKLAHHYQMQGKKVLIAAADTFRAAAMEQLELWATKANCEIVKGKQGSDPAAVVFDAIEAAKNRHCDIVLVDTAGRLHTKTDLMKELEKIRRVCGKAHPGAPHETLLVLDATIGQNGVDQAKMFHNFTPLTGLVLTKLDGSAKGGTAISIQKTLQLPVTFIGTGEQMKDLEAFDPKTFVSQLFAD